MSTVKISRPKRPTGQLATVNAGEFKGRMVHILPQDYLQPFWAWVCDQETGIELALKREDLEIL